ncbi:MAG: flagellar hook-basal body complex protein [Clostridiales bacterium]|nr:flagellar hook-basal body complex protein [Clostridiales bacterium]
MLKSLSSAVSGLQNHQTMMDVIGNNVANVNTAGFKSSRVVFSDVYYQTLSSANGATETTGGTNSAQTGYGSKVASVDVLNTNSGMTETGRALDAYIDGDGYFVIQNADGTKNYTKLGNMYFDTNGSLVDSNGNYVCGSTGEVLSDPVDASAISPIKIESLSNYSNISISKDGKITGVNNDSTSSDAGTTVTLGQIALGYFANTQGLSELGNGYYAETANSGTAALYVPGNSNVGSLVSGALASSNVDLTKEFTDMIVAQRGFQANARVITTSDSMLEELVNLKR